MIHHKPQEAKAPDAEEQHIEQQLKGYLQSLCQEQGGRLSFFDFMQAALYTPSLGYYCNTREKLGQGGDFTTAPEHTPLYADSIGLQCIQCREALFSESEPWCILEFGPGRGQWAYDILTYLEHQDALPDQYYLLDVSADLVRTQKQTLSQLSSSIQERLVWIRSLDELPADLHGVILANEVVDALPAHRFHVKQSQPIAYDVGLGEGEHFVWKSGHFSEDERKRLNDYLTPPCLMGMSVSGGHKQRLGFVQQQNDLRKGLCCWEIMVTPSRFIITQNVLLAR